MFVIELLYTAALAEIDAHMTAHVKFLKQQYAAGVFLVGGGPDHVVGIDTGGALAAPIFELPKAIAGLRKIDPQARERLIDFLVDHREVMSYTP